MSEHIDPPHVNDYRAKGYAVVRAVFDGAEIAAMAASFDREWRTGLGHGRTFRHGNLYYRVATDENLGPILRLVQWPAYHDPLLAAIRHDARMQALLAPLIGRDIKQIINQLHWKPRGAAMSDFAFHQDSRFRRPREAYRDLAANYVQTGIAIDQHRAASGAMRLLPGSHLLGEIEIGGTDRISSTRASEEALTAAGLDPSALVDLELEPGDVALWHPFMVHSSGPNRTAADRRLYINGYVRADACDRGEWAFRDGAPCPLGAHRLVHYEDLLTRPGPHYPE
ncbi:MAG: phytanoyl-CoA dioxygenase family protein [Alphaproteobacteria bacterium]|nr:phytanoyl-CoA dioxygenase family protein [Alphaproteobacteria bacterium]